MITCFYSVTTAKFLCILLLKNVSWDLGRWLGESRVFWACSSFQGWGWAVPWALMAGQPSLLRELQANEKRKGEKKRKTKMAPRVVLGPPHACFTCEPAHTWTCVHGHIQSASWLLHSVLTFWLVNLPAMPHLLKFLQPPKTALPEEPSIKTRYVGW